MNRVDLLSQDSLGIQIAQKVGWCLSSRVVDRTRRWHTGVGIVGMAMMLKVSPQGPGVLLMVVQKGG